VASWRAHSSFDHWIFDFPLIDWAELSSHSAKRIFMTTKSILIPAALAIALVVGTSSAPVQAAGCLEGAAVGGAAGHLAGHHTLVGAGVGCLIGRHEANKNERDNAYRNEREDAAQEREFGGGGRW